MTDTPFTILRDLIVETAADLSNENPFWTAGCLADALIKKGITHTQQSETPVAWMPITDDVKDGRSVLVWRDDWDEPVIARWVCCYDFLTDAEIAESGLDDEALAKCDWFAADFMQGCRLENDTAPTHWQPLPAAPDHIVEPTVMVPATDVAALVEALQAQMEEQSDDITPSSVQRDKGLVWLEGWFDISAALAHFTKGQP